MHPIHPIRRYCRKHDITQSEFAGRCGLSNGYISQLISGRELCGAAGSISISRASDGEISIEELILWGAEQRGAA